jgi:hypothetical protein
MPQNPALHVQLVLPGGASEFAAHALHPLVATPQNPALHVQSVSLVLAGGALEFAGHF